MNAPPAAHRRRLGAVDVGIQASPMALLAVGQFIVILTCRASAQILA